jgi:CRP-like cAMP-binding protein
MSDADRAILTPHLEPVALEHRKQLERANENITHAYFPESGVVSVVAKSGSDQIEAGVIGREGVTFAVILGNHRSPNDVHVQIEGRGHSIDAEHLRTAMAASSSLRLLLTRYAQTFMTQVAQTALFNGRAKLDERLARWLLMTHDRLDDDDVRLTHEFISLMLGVRRPGVTEALNELEGKGFIRSNRGAIRILDRDGLLQIAGAAYGVPEAEYARLLGSGLGPSN